MSAPTPSDAEGVGALLDKAEVMLSLAGEPSTPSEYLLHAQTAAMIAMVKALGYNRQVTPAPQGQYYVPYDIDHILVGKGVSSKTIHEAMRAMETVVPDWDLKKIHAIKEVRSNTHLGLKEAKEIVDYSVTHLATHGSAWWR